MQDDAAHQLHVEMALAEGALGRLAHGGKGLDQQVVELGAVVEALAETGGAGGQRLVGEGFQARLELVDLLDIIAEGLDVPVIGGAEQPPGEGAEHENLDRRVDERERKRTATSDR